MAQDNLNGAVTHSVQQSLADPNLINYSPDSGIGILPLLVRAGELIAPYWSRARDAQLSQFALKVDHVSSAFSMFISKTATIPLRIIPRDMSIKSHIKQADDLTANLNEMSNWGKGWVSSFAPQMIYSFITQDNGMTAEVIGDGQADKERRGFYGLRFLDPSLVQRTSNPEYPIIFWDIGVGGTGLRFKMHHTRVMTATSLPQTFTRLNGMGFCLDRDSTVQMADGSYRRIVDLVKSKSTELVKSIDELGNFIEKPITNWYINPLANRRMINIRGDKARLTQGVKERNSWVTEDHPVLTPNGWVNAGQLQTGDSIITGLPTPNQKQKEFLIGTLLGDGSLLKRNSHYRPRFSMGHSISQKEWFDLKSNVLCEDYGFESRLYDAKMTYLGTEKIFPMYSGQTLAQAGFEDLYQSFYQDKKKVIPLDLIRQNISPLMLATWYLDDGNIVDKTRKKPLVRASRGGGYYTVEITTTGFEVEQVEQLAALLTEFGYEAVTVYVRRNNKERKSIRLLKQGAINFFNDIAPYVPQSMRYKLPPNAPEFNYQLWNLGQAERLIDTVKIRTKFNKKIQTVYCIDVEDTHNFISAGIVVHNCAMSRMINTAQHLLDISTMEQEELGSRPKRRMIIGKQGVTAQEIYNAFQQADLQMDNQGLSRYSKSVVIGKNTAPTSNNSIEIDVQELHSALLGEDKERSITLGMFLIALALNIPPRWLWPATSTGATKADAMFQHLAGMGGGVGMLLEVFGNMLGGTPLATALGKPVPSHLKAVFDNQDDEQDRSQAEIRKTRNETWNFGLTGNSINTRTVRQQMLDAGDLTEQQYDDLELEDGRLPDGTDTLNLFMSTDPDIVQMLSLSVGDVLNPSANDRDTVLQAISDQEIEVRAILANPVRPTIFDKAKMCFAALQALRTLYLQPTPEEMQEDLNAIDEANQDVPQVDNEKAPDKKDEEVIENE